MALNNGPYFTATSQSLDGLGNNDLHEDASIYPDLGQSITTNAQMYTLANGALQAHQRNSHSDLAGLIRAATVAAGQQDEETQDLAVMGDLSQRMTRRSQGKGSTKHEVGQSEQPELQMSGSQSLKEHVAQSQGNRKRKGLDDGHSPIPGRGLIGASSHGGDQNASAEISHSGPQGSISDARAASVPSAAALFRRPSTSSKKYTRPPMSKLFTSLELSPENFLHLQAAAKGYMLDPSYPERRECVGQRGKGDSELVKLRLWNCVKEFLESEGSGERFFGPHVPGDEGMTRTMIWRADKNRIIGAVTPLLRRMVTNERQRQYAVETRKSGAVNGDDRNKRRKLSDAILSPLDDLQQQADPGTNHAGTDLGLQELFMEINGARLDEYDFGRKYDVCNLALRLDNLAVLAGLSESDFNGVFATVDYHLQKVHGEGRDNCNRSCEDDTISRMLVTGLLDHRQWQSKSQSDVEDKHVFARSVLREIFRSVKEANGYPSPIDQWKEVTRRDRHMTFAKPTLPADSMQMEIAHPQSEGAVEPLLLNDGLMLHFNILKAGRRSSPRLVISAHDCPTIQTVFGKVLEDCSELTFSQARLSVLLPRGLISVQSDTEWTAALRSARCIDWMDGELKAIIEVHS